MNAFFLFCTFYRVTMRFEVFPENTLIFHLLLIWSQGVYSIFIFISLICIFIKGSVVGKYELSIIRNDSIFVLFDSKCDINKKNVNKAFSI